MSLQQPNPMQRPNPFSAISTGMQVDDNSRMMVAQFFGDPQSREFVNQSGGIENAISNPQNPWGISTNQPSQNNMPGGDQQIADIPPPQAAAAPPAMAPPQATPMTGASPAATGTPHDYALQHPDEVNLPQRAVDPMDKVHGAKKALLLAFLGLNKFGSSLSGQPNAYADQFLGRSMDAQERNATMDANMPQLKVQAEGAAYDKFLGRTKTQADIANTRSETDFRNKTVPPQQLQIQQQLREHYQKLTDAWTKDPRYIGNPQSFIRAAQASSVGLPVDPKMVEEIMQQPQVSNKYSIQYSKEGGVPEGINDNLGHPVDVNNVTDPAARQMWEQAQAGYNKARGDKRADADHTAQIGADRAVTAVNAKTQEQGRTAAAKHLVTLREAQNQNELVQQLASSKSPTDQTSLAFKALGLDLPDGVHRINETELNAIRNQGSLSQRAERALLNWKTGEQFEPEIIEDIKKTAQTITQSKMKNANDNLEDTYRLYGFKAPGSGDTGRFEAGSTVQTRRSKTTGEIQQLVNGVWTKVSK